MAYSLATSYAGDALINGFNWVDTRDPSNGYVRYQSQSNAASQGLFAVDEVTGVVRLGVDSTNTYSVSSGRPSIRIESKLAYNRGLFIGDFLHMPPSQCGAWPAFWAYGPNWPAGGEIDIIEGANNAHRNIISAHTTPGCELGPDVLAMAAGSPQTTNCDVGTQNIGCGYVPEANDTSSYGDTFNAVGGGIYAMLWDDDYIKIWHFDRASAPADIAAKRPDPDGWPRPQAVYGGDSCDVGAKFRDMSLVLNINFCGDYGDAVWASNGCTALAPTCAEWVGENPAAFANAYWDVNYIDAYVLGPAGNGTASNGTATSSGKTPSSSGKEPSGNVTRAASSYSLSAASSSSSPSSSPGFLYITAGNTQTTTAVAVAAGPIPTQSLVPRPAPSNKAHANPANIEDFSYLGCFGSSSGFSSFTKVGDSADMNLVKCTSLCRGKKYAGLFDTSCYCAAELDPDTRVSADACNEPCPGDPSHFCGGRVASKLPADGPNAASPVAAGPIIAGPIAATANVTQPKSTPSVVSGGAAPLRPDGASADGSANTHKFKPSGFAKVTPTGTGSPAVPSFANSTAPEILSDRPDSFDSGSSVTTGTGTASPMISSAAKFNGTGFAKPSGFHRTTQSKSFSAPAPVVPARLNSTTSGPSISAFASTTTAAGTGTGAGRPVATVPVYPIPAKNATAPTPSSPKMPAPVGTGSASGADGPAVIVPVYPIPAKNATAPTPSSSPKIPALVASGSAAGAAAPVKTVSVYPVPAKNATKPTPSSPRIPAPVGTGAAAGTSTDGPAVVVPVYPIPAKNATKPTPSSPRVPAVLPSASAVVLSDAAAAAAPGGPASDPSDPAPAGMLPNSTTLVGRRLLAAHPHPSKLVGVHRLSVHSREAADFLLTVYAAVAEEEPPKQPPAMGNTEPHAPPPPVPQAATPSASDVLAVGSATPGSSDVLAAAAATPGSSDVLAAAAATPGSSEVLAAAAATPSSSDVLAAAAATPAPTPAPTPAGSRSTTTTVVTTASYETVYPSNPTRIFTAVFVTTIVKAHCGCTETPVPVLTVPMSTKVVTCSACGRNGESTVTITVPCSVSVEANPTPAGVAPPPHPHAAGGEPPAVTQQPAPVAPGKYEQPKPSSKVMPASNGNTPPPPQAAGDASLAVNQHPGGKYEQFTHSGNAPPAGDESQAVNQKPAVEYEQPKPGSDEEIAASSGNTTPSPPPQAGGGASPAVNHEPAPVAPGKYEQPGSKVMPAASGNTPPPPPANRVSSAIVPPAPSGSGTPSGQPARPPPIVVAGASGFKVTSLLFSTVLAMVLLL